MTADAKRRSTRNASWPVAPAAVALVACGGLTALVLTRGIDPSPETLLTRAEAAVAAGDTTTALLHQQHLMAVEPGRPGHAVALARSLDRTKRRREAVAVLTTVAPESKDGYPPAHLLLAEWGVEAHVMGGGQDAAALAVARRHAEAAGRDPTLASRAGELVRLIDGLSGTP